jgi:hypothetical protein
MIILATVPCSESFLKGDSVIARIVQNLHIF